MNPMLSKIYSPSRREEGLSLTETVIAVVIIVLVLTATAYALTSAFGGTNSAQNFNKAYQLINKQFALAKQVSFDKLGIVQSEAATQTAQVQALAYCDSSNPSVANTLTNIYNRRIDIPGSKYRSYTTADSKCNASVGDRSNITCPTYPTDTSTLYKGESRVTIPFSNSNVAGNFENNGDPGTSQTTSSPIYCAWYQFAQGNGDTLYKDDVDICNGGTTAGAPHGCASGGVGTIFTVETDVTWVNAANFDKQADGTTANNNTGSFNDCFAVTANQNCFQGKRVTVTVRWVESSPNGPVQRGVTSSFIRAPNISNCLPVGGNGFNANATPAPTPVATSTKGVSGVSCGQI